MNNQCTTCTVGKTVVTSCLFAHMRQYLGVVHKVSSSSCEFPPTSKLVSVCSSIGN